MPTILPPRRRRSAPEPEESDDTGDTLIPVLIICMLLFANLALFCEKYVPPNNYTLAAAPAEFQLLP